MSMNRKHQAGLHNVGSYQVSGVPWISGSVVEAATEHKFEFPTVAKQLILANTSSANACWVYFNEAAAGDVVDGRHYLILGAQKQTTLNVKCKEIYLSGAYGQAGAIIFAELTGIPSESMYDLTGSGLTTIDGT